MGARSRFRPVAVLGVLVLSTAVSLAAQPPADACMPTTVGIAYEGVAVRGDPYNELVAQGVARAVSRYGVKVVKAVQGDRTPEAVLTQLVRQKAQLVIAVGFGYLDAVGSVAARYPRTHFAVIDGEPTVPAPNVQAVLFATDEGSFLVGAAAGLHSASARIGFLGGMDLPVIEEFRAAFAAGVRYVDPTAALVTEYVGSFADPAAAKEIALEMYSSGVDVIFPVAGSSGTGVLEAAREYSASHPKVWMIGVDTDLYQQVDASLKPFVLTSMVKRVDVATFQTVKAQVNGRFVGGVQVFGLARNGVGYASSGGFLTAYAAQLQAVRAQIVAGSILVP